MVDTLQPAALAILSVNIAISSVFILLRISARVVEWRNGNKLHRLIIWSDALLMCAYILAIGNTYTSIKYTLLSWQGYHVYDIPKMSTAQKTVVAKTSLANQLLYNPILTLVKASVIFFLLRIGGTKPYIKRALYAIFFVNAALVVSVFIADALQCTPFHYVYDSSWMDLAAQKAAGADSKGMVDGVVVKGGKCFDQRLFFLVTAGLAVATDLVVIAIPTLIVWDLKMTRKKKIAAAAVLSTGAIVTGVSIIRLILYHWRFDPANKDTTYNVDYTTSSMEANLSIAAACISSLGPLIQRFLPKLLGSGGTSKSYGPASGAFHKSGEGGQFPLKAVGGRRETLVRSKTTKTHGDSVLDGWNSEEAIMDTSAIRKTVNVQVSFDAKSTREKPRRYEDSF